MGLQPSHLSRLWALAMLAILSSVTAIEPALAQDVPPGFQRDKVATVNRPTAFTFSPQGDLYAVSQGGRLIVDALSADDTPRSVLDLSDRVCDVDGEQGLLGVAVDPAMTETANRFVYLYYSAKKARRCAETVNRVSRFEVGENGTVSRASETVLIDNIPTPGTNGNHNGGDLQFGADGYLYVSVGDGACSLRDPEACQAANPNAQRKNVLLGKILRITKTGGIPAGNPYKNVARSARCNRTGTTKDPRSWCQEIWATGFRNPFRMAFDEARTTLYINDVGGQLWEEIDEGKSGANYGWNRCEGTHKTNSVNEPCGDPSFVNPVFEYRHQETPLDGDLELKSITGGAFVPDDAIAWPDKFRGGYLFADLGGGIYLMDPETEPETDNPAIRAIAPIHLVFHEGALYYSDIGAGAIFRVQPTA